MRLRKPILILTRPSNRTSVELKREPVALACSRRLTSNRTSVELKQTPVLQTRNVTNF